MPNRHYKKVTKRLINRAFESKNENNTVHQYFFDVIDSIILYSDMNISIKQIKSLIEFISSKEEVYVLLDKIESLIEDIIMNIHEDINVDIINERITYVRSLLSTIPDNYNNYIDISVLILNILESVTTSFDFNTVYSNIIYIEQLMSTDMNVYESIQLIHLTILSIVSNIENGASNFIIKQRIDYLQTLINKL